MVRVCVARTSEGVGLVWGRGDTFQELGVGKDGGRGAGGDALFNSILVWIPCRVEYPTGLGEWSSGFGAYVSQVPQTSRLHLQELSVELMSN